MKITAGLREIELIERLGWFISLRWGIFLFLLTSALFARLFLDITLPVLPVFLLTLFIALYNVFFRLYLGRIKKSSLVVVDLPERAVKFTCFQTGLDLFTLLLLIHFLGGAENPFIFYFIFHTVITSTLLPKRLSYIQAFIVCAATGGLILGEFMGIIPHRPLEGFISTDLYSNPGYVLAVFTVFSTSIFFTTFLATSISERLRDEERELSVKSNDLEKANRALTDKDRLKSEYVRMVAHDLKSPLSSVSSLLETVLEGYSGDVGEKTHELVERAQKKVNFLHHYAKDLLDLSRMRSKESLKLEEVDLEEVIDQALSISAPKGEGKEIRININCQEGLPPITADREQILFVLINLISNSLKYTPEGGAISIDALREDGTFKVKVSDTGIGIPAEEISGIFSEFYRASNVAGTTKGTGLGLTLVKYIVERHGGAVGVASTLGKGTVFTVTLPSGKSPGKIQ